METQARRCRVLSKFQIIPLLLWQNCNGNAASDFNPHTTTRRVANVSQVEVKVVEEEKKQAGLQ